MSSSIPSLPSSIEITCFSLRSHPIATVNESDFKGSVGGFIPKEMALLLHRNISSLSSDAGDIDLLHQGNIIRYAYLEKINLIFYRMLWDQSHVNYKLDETLVHWEVLEQTFVKEIQSFWTGHAEDRVVKDFKSSIMKLKMSISITGECLKGSTKKSIGDLFLNFFNAEKFIPIEEFVRTRHSQKILGGSRLLENSLLLSNAYNVFHGRVFLKSNKEREKFNEACTMFISVGLLTGNEIVWNLGHLGLRVLEILDCEKYKETILFPTKLTDSLKYKFASAASTIALLSKQISDHGPQNKKLLAVLTNLTDLNVVRFPTEELSKWWATLSPHLASGSSDLIVEYSSNAFLEKLLTQTVTVVEAEKVKTGEGVEATKLEEKKGFDEFDEEYFADQVAQEEKSDEEEDFVLI